MRSPVLYHNIGGEAGIRTLGGVAPSLVFETSPFDRSGTSPHSRQKPKVYNFCTASQLHSILLHKFLLPLPAQPISYYE